MISLKSLFCAVSWSCRLGAKCGRRLCTSSSAKPAMTAWQIQNYGDKLTYNCEAEKPTLRNSTDVLVKVQAVSANPIDILIEAGFARTLLDELRNIFGTKESLPLILGRDFAGKIESVGNVVKNFKPGDRVYGTVPLQSQGALADYVVTSCALVAKRPKHVSVEEAAGILYVGLTAWSSLKVFGGLLWNGTQNIRALVIGGSGGVGLTAIQLLKHWGAQVVTTCSSDAIDLVKSMRPNQVIDYTLSYANDLIEKAGKYDIILDASGIAPASTYAPFLSEKGTFIALRSPLFGNLDKHGMLGGLIQSGKDLYDVNVSSGASIRWGFFLPVAQGVLEISDLVANKKLKPVVHFVFPYTDVPEAYERVKEGHLRGKVVISKKIESKKEVSSI